MIHTSRPLEDLQPDGQPLQTLPLWLLSAISSLTLSVSALQVLQKMAVPTISLV